MSQYVRMIRPCRVILVGMMGSGKTTVGRLPSGLTGWPYHDNDGLLLDRVGLTARQILERDGVAIGDAARAALDCPI